MNLNKSTTSRGFDIIEFNDLYNEKCNIQKSSLVTEDAIWIGVESANPQIMASKVVEGGTGWIPYEIPDDVLLSTRMHLSQEQVKELLPFLQVFADTGDLPE